MDQGEENAIFLEFAPLFLHVKQRLGKVLRISKKRF